MYVVCVNFEILPEHYDAFRAAVQAQAMNSLSLEVHCHVFDVCLNENDSGVFLYEHYSDPAAFDDHLKSGHFRDFDARTRPWVKSKRISTWQLLEHCA